MSETIRYIIIICLCLLLIFLYIKPKLSSNENFTPSPITDLSNNIQLYLEDLSKNPYYPAGIISMWSGPIKSIPSGWALCDGHNNTPDLHARFILGYNPDNITQNNINISKNVLNQIGGSETVSLDSTQIPGHAHTLLYYFNLNEISIPEPPSCPLGGFCDFGNAVINYTVPAVIIMNQLKPGQESEEAPPSAGTPHFLSMLPTNTPTNYNNHATLTNGQYGDTNQAAALNGIFPSAPHNNMPPYYVLAYIMRLPFTDPIPIYKNPLQTISAFLMDLSNNPFFPSGIINMWSGTISSIPYGWVLCDGKSHNTPNLSGKFIVGYNRSFINKGNIHLSPRITNKFGGSETEILSSANVPGHSHSLLYNFDLSTRCDSQVGGENRPCGDVRTSDLSVPTNYSRPLNNTNTQYGNMTKPPDFNGNYPASPHNNMPPYYVLAYIMKK